MYSFARIQHRKLIYPRLEFKYDFNSQLVINQPRKFEFPRNSQVWFQNRRAKWRKQCKLTKNSTDEIHFKSEILDESLSNSPSPQFPPMDTSSNHSTILIFTSLLKRNTRTWISSRRYRNSHLSRIPRHQPTHRSRLATLQRAARTADRQLDSPAAKSPQRCRRSDSTIGATFVRQSQPPELDLYLNHLRTRRR